MKTLVTLCAVMLVMLAIGTARANDYNPPDWRGEPLTTYQRWEFGTADNPAIPEDDYTNPLGIPILAVGGAYPDTVWLSEDMGHFGVWFFQDSITIQIANFDNDNPLKEIWMQLTYSPQIGGEPVVLTDPDYTWIAPSDEQAIDAYYWQMTYHIGIEPNPSLETITIEPPASGGGLYLDELVIDTICVPEPATICLFGLGALVLLRKRKK